MVRILKICTISVRVVVGQTLSVIDFLQSLRLSLF